jgi:hypothetical protein
MICSLIAQIILRFPEQAFILKLILSAEAHLHHASGSGLRLSEKQAWRSFAVAPWHTKLADLTRRPPAAAGSPEPSKEAR